VNAAVAPMTPGKGAQGQGSPAALFQDWLPAAGRSTGQSLPWLAAQRVQARARVRELGVPSPKSEGWRYSSLSPLLEQGFRAVGEASGEAGSALDPGALQTLLIPELRSHRVVLVNGRFDAALSALGTLPRGVRIGGLRDSLARDPDALEGLLTSVAGDGSHVFTAINTASLDDGVVLLMERGALLEEPLEVIHVALPASADARGHELAPPVAHPRLLFSLGDGAQAEIIERYVGPGGGPSCTNAVVEIALGRGALLRHRRIQDEHADGFHLSGVYLSQGADSRYEGINIGLGGRWARTDLVMRFTGEHAECDLRGLYLAGDRQLLDYHLDVHHGLPHCASRENFKGILFGKGRAVFDGLVYVAPDAQKTDAAMSNRNLILSPNAEVDTKPQLEIYADDVKCSHGTTVGQIEPEMLFYLRSRGISAGLARRMLCLGFAGEIIDGLGPAALREHVTEQVGARLEQAPL